MHAINFEAIVYFNRIAPKSWHCLSTLYCPFDKQFVICQTKLPKAQDGEGRLNTKTKQERKEIKAGSQKN